MTARNSAQSFQAWCVIQHAPPDPPFFSENFGFESVILDTNVFPFGVYVVSLKVPLDLEKNQVIGQFVQDGAEVFNIGTLFYGSLGPTVPGDPNKIGILRLWFKDNPEPQSGPFKLAIVNQQ